MDSIKKNKSVLINVGIFIGLIVVAAIFVIVPHYKSIKDSANSANANPKTLDGQIVLLNQQIKTNPDNIQLYISLSQTYLQKVRETADVAYYQKINDLMDKAEKLDPKNADVPATRASVELGRHHFKEGENFANAALTLNPHNHLYYGLLGDADIELGKYTEAVKAYQEMVNLRPDYSAYIRIAYIRELYGDIKGAKETLRLAIDSGSNIKESLAFAYVELGKQDMRGDLNQASKDFKDALEIVPDYPTALEGLGKIAYFKGDNTQAEKYFGEAYNKLPIVQYATDLGDLYSAEGISNKAKQYYTLGQTSFTQSETSGVNTDLEQSLFLSDHDLNLGEALSRAERAYADRPSIYAADYLSWAHYKNGEFDKASQYEKEALRLGETDPLILFHQGMIAAKNGDRIKAKKYLSASLKLNPRFSILQADVLSKTLKTL